MKRIIPYNPALKEFATQLRNNSTKAEIILWQKLKRKQMHGYDFHRQKPIDNYILDFFCQELMLGIEIDGYSHEFLEVYNKDVVKEAKMNEFGIAVLRFSDHQVLKDTENVIRAIEQYIVEYKEHISCVKYTPIPSQEGNTQTGKIATEEHTPNPSQEGSSFTQSDVSIIHTDLPAGVEAPLLRWAGGVSENDIEEEGNLTKNLETILDKDNQLLKQLSKEEHTPNPSQEGNTQPNRFLKEEHTPNPSQEGNTQTGKIATEEHTPNPSQEGNTQTGKIATEEHTPKPSQEGNSFTQSDVSIIHTDLPAGVEAPLLRGAGGVSENDIEEEGNLTKNLEKILDKDNQLLKQLSKEEHTPTPSREGNILTDKNFTHINFPAGVEAPLLRGAGGVSIRPMNLKPHDRVGIISTAKRTEPHEIAQGLTMLQSWGLVPVVGPNAFNEYGFLAGTDAERLADLQQMLDDEQIKAIFFTKGGYGTLRIIDGVNWDKFRQNPKWLIGYSDITLLHCHVHNFGIQSLHGVMLQAYEKATVESTESIRKILFGESLEYQIPSAPDNRVGDVVTGTLVGGNLSMLYSVTGSESDINTDDKILFIEDIDEYRYHYDRMLVSLKRAGKLSGVKAVIVGDMTDIKESTLPWGRDYREITLEHFDCPVYFDFPAGHISDNRALLMGGKVTIASDAEISITFHK